MYTLVRNLWSREAALVEAPAFVGALVIAELFYKFHSFTLECLAFLATWMAISSIAALATRRRANAPQAAE